MQTLDDEYLFDASQDLLRRLDLFSRDGKSQACDLVGQPNFAGAKCASFRSNGVLWNT